MAQRRANKRWRKARALPAQTPAPAANDAAGPANDPAPASDPALLALLDLFPKPAVDASLARRAAASAATTELQRAARRIERKKPADRGRIDPTPEQLRRGTIVIVKTKDPAAASSIEVPRNAAAPIDRWRARGTLTPRQFDACDRYRDDYARGGYERSVISRYDGGGGSGDGTPNMTGALAGTIAQMDARKRLREACNAMPRRFAAYFDQVVLYEAAAELVGGAIGAVGNARAAFAIFVVQTCADILGDFYRLPE